MWHGFLKSFFLTMGFEYFTPGHACMILIGCLLIFLAINKKYEPLLLIPIGFGAILANLPIREVIQAEFSRPARVLESRLDFTVSLPDQGIKFDQLILLPESSEDFSARVREVRVLAVTKHKDSVEQVWKNVDASLSGKLLDLPLGIYQSVEVSLDVTSGPVNLREVRIVKHAGIMDPGGLLDILYQAGMVNGLFPLLIFLGIGALTDFSPLLADPKTILLGAAAQFGIFVTLICALILGFDLKEAASIGIIGGADGPTSIYLSSRMAEHLLAPISIAAYSYMAMVPIIQPPVMRLLTTKKERAIRMGQLKHISKRTRLLFPVVAVLICALIVPGALPLIGMLMFGNLLRESGVTDRLAKTAQNELVNISTIFIGLCVGGKMDADSFLDVRTLSILLLGLAAFMFGTAAGLLFAKLMNLVARTKINPLIGAAGVSAVPMAARVAQDVALKENSDNYLLMHAMGPNVAGVIGSAVVAGYFLAVIAR